ncbi:MAG: hypothetical protein K2N63_17785 [Lachnospiraceae bacterium]|nr:hypothetical protein [Lachnospiraceae bacterium]
MREDTIKNEDDPITIPMDETDQKIMQALADELSGITVSGELIDRTLQKAQLHAEPLYTAPFNTEPLCDTPLRNTPLRNTQSGISDDRGVRGKKGGESLVEAVGGKDAKKAAKKNWSNRRTFGTMLAFAVLALVVFGVWEIGKNGDYWNYKQGDYSGGNVSTESGQKSEEGLSPGYAGEGNSNPVGGGIITEWDTLGNNQKGEGFQDNQLNQVDGSLEQGVENGNLSPEEALPGESPDPSCPEPEDTTEWIYQLLLEEFDRIENLAEGMDGVPAGELDGAADGQRSIFWQKEDGTLTCVIYEPDYRIEAVLDRNGQTFRIVLFDWEYAEVLWEMAGKP